VYATQHFGAQDGQSLPGYGTVDMRVDLIGVHGSGLSVGLFAKNLLDKDYLLSPVILVPALPVSTAVIGEPRTFGAELHYTF
jgi:iron complex outermembrane receptor protein